MIQGFSFLDGNKGMYEDEVFVKLMTGIIVTHFPIIANFDYQNHGYYTKRKRKVRVAMPNQLPGCAFPKQP